MSDAFFTAPDCLDDPAGTWFVPTDLARGPWVADACHAGPPTGLIARASERAVAALVGPAQPLLRLTVDLVRPVPMAGFRVEAEVVRAGRSVTTTLVRLVDGAGREVLTARGMHVAAGEVVVPPAPEAPADGWPVLDESVPGPFPIEGAAHGLTCFVDAVETRWPPGEGGTPGPSTVWMRTPPLLAEEEPSPFQRICPLADCGNAVSRLAEPREAGLSFMNTDLTIALHRPPVGEWFASRSTSWWQPTGHGQSDSLLLDAHGPVGRAVQTLLLRPLA